MADYAVTSELVRESVKTVEVDTPLGPRLFDIRKTKAGDRARLREECLDADGILDLVQANILACHLCVVRPALTLEEAEQLDEIVWVQIVEHLNAFVGTTVEAMATPDPEEGAAQAAQFRAEGSESEDAGEVDAPATDSVATDAAE